MGSTCGARVGGFPSSRAAHEAVPCRTRSKSQAGGVRGIPPLRKERARMGHPACLQSKDQDPKRAATVESHSCAKNAQEWATRHSRQCVTAELKLCTTQNQRRKSTATGEDPFGFA